MGALVREGAAFPPEWRQLVVVFYEILGLSDIDEHDVFVCR